MIKALILYFLPILLTLNTHLADKIKQVNSAKASIASSKTDKKFCGPNLFAQNSSGVVDNLVDVYLYNYSTGQTEFFNLYLSSSDPEIQLPHSGGGYWRIQIRFFTEHPTDWGYLTIKENGTPIKCYTGHYGWNEVTFENVFLDCNTSYKIETVYSPC